jgi:hypothetical protein
MQIGGGLGEEYMRAPTLNVGGGKGKGGGGFIAGILDLLGIHRQVDKEPKEGTANAETSQVPADKPAPPQSAPPPPGLTILDDAEAAFKPLTPAASRMGSLGFLPNTLR